MNPLMIDAQEVSHSYSATPALCGVSFSVNTGSFFGLLGPNGSGKTTLFRLLSTLIPLQQGRLRIAGFDIREQQNLVRQQIGVTFQSPALDVRLTVLENLQCHAAIYGLNGSIASGRISELLRRFRIEDRAKTIVGTLSGGLKRRAELAKGLLHQPKVLFLDEPGTGLDIRSRKEFLALLREQQKEFGTTIVMATHHMEEAEECDQLMLLDQGRVIASGSPRELQGTLQGERLTVRCQNPEKFSQDLRNRFSVEPQISGDTVTCRLESPAEKIPEILRTSGDEVLSIQISRPSLEDVFLSLTGRLLQQEVP
jgi:ABC-2 type transport system ATP-binding protein